MFEEYKKIIESELKLRGIEYPYGENGRILPVNYEAFFQGYLYPSVWQIFEVAKSAFISRSYNSRYFLCGDETVYESVSAHTNLVSAIGRWAFEAYKIYIADKVDELPWFYDGYTYMEIEEAIRLHDLSENEIGDIPDNGSRDETEKNLIEMAYYKKYADKYPSPLLRKHVLELLEQMQSKSSLVGRMIYLSDKVAALIITLCLDQMDDSPLTHFESPFISERDVEEMKICDVVLNGNKYRASEMWTIDFFKMRELCQYDDTMYFTALIVAATLETHLRWYNWRKADYIT